MAIREDLGSRRCRCRCRRLRRARREDQRVVVLCSVASIHGSFLVPNSWSMKRPIAVLCGQLGRTANASSASISFLCGLDRAPGSGGERGQDDRPTFATRHRVYG